ncbi:flagellar protein FliT, partial [Rhizobium ruizarguesonis]
MTDQVETVMKQLLNKSVELRDLIFSYRDESDNEVERWSSLLSQRQELMDQIDSLIQNGMFLTAEHKQTYLSQILLIDEQVKPILQNHMVKLQLKIAEMQRKRSVSRQ